MTFCLGMAIVLLLVVLASEWLDGIPTLDDDDDLLY